MSIGQLQEAPERSVRADIEAALAAGIRAAEAGRKVGWAKAFEALRRIDSLEEDLRQTRDELRYLRRAYSRLAAVVQHVPMPRTEVLNSELAAHFAAERSFRVTGAHDEGMAVARRHTDLLDGITEDQILERRRRDRARRDAANALKRAAHETGHRVAVRREDGRPRTCACNESLVDVDVMDHYATAVYGKRFSELWRSTEEEGA